MVHTVSPSDRGAVRSLIQAYSIEMTGKDSAALRDAAPYLPHGARVNVTFLAGEDIEMRLEAARTVLDLGFVPIPHIPARRLRSAEELEEILKRMQEIGATDKVFLIAGDPAEPEGPYSSALDVIRSGILERFGVTEVGIAGYPEGHPDISDQVLWTHLEAKTAEIASRGFDAVIVTQFAFDAERVVSWISDVRKRGIAAPIRIGTPGPAGVKRLLAFARRFGIGANAMIVKKYGFSLTNLMGTAGPDRFVTALATTLRDQRLNAGVALHLYAFGGLSATARWADDFIGSLGGE